MMISTIEARNVCKRFGNHVVLQNVGFNLTGSRIYGIIGRNGSGKTVLMKCICGLMYLDNGEILVNGKSISKPYAVPENVGALIETPGFLPYLSGFENLKALAMYKKITSDAQIRQMMLELGLDPYSHQKTKKYSLGMKQKLGIIQTWLDNPNILIYDEPMNSLDYDSVQKVRGILKKKKEEGKLILISSHIRDDIECLCDEVYEMADGNLYVHDGRQ